MMLIEMKILFEGDDDSMDEAQQMRSDLLADQYIAMRDGLESGGPRIVSIDINVIAKEPNESRIGPVLPQ